MKRIIFCDFDGTITAEETFVAVLKEFAPSLSAKLIPQMYALKLTLREGVQQILESIPSSRMGDILEFTRAKLIRPGFVELLDFLDFQGVPLVVVSGGLREMVEVVLEPHLGRIHAIHAVKVDKSGSYLQVLPGYEGKTELVDKVQVMDGYAVNEKIAIGDSVTDLNMAQAVPLVFARDRLAVLLDERQRSYVPWNDFLEVRDYLVGYWKV